MNVICIRPNFRKIEPIYKSNHEKSFDEILKEMKVNNDNEREKKAEKETSYTKG